MIARNSSGATLASKKVIATATPVAPAPVLEVSPSSISFGEQAQSDNAYRVQMDSSGQRYWMAEVAGKEVRYDEDPLSTLQQRLKAGWIRVLPIEDQL